jgi:hypothetical protein
VENTKWSECWGFSQCRQPNNQTKNRQMTNRILAKQPNSADKYFVFQRVFHIFAAEIE